MKMGGTMTYTEEQLNIEYESHKSSPDNRLISQSNELITATYSLTLPEKRVVLLAASKLNPMDKGQGRIRIDASDYAHIFNVTISHAYQSMIDAGKSLTEKNPVKFTRKSDQATVITNWVGHIAYKESEGWLEISFGEPMREHFYDLCNGEGGYTSLKLLHVGALKTFYSVRVFEMIMAFKKQGYFVISLEDFKSRLNIENKYKQFGDLKIKVINPLVKDINKADKSLKLKFKPLKRGRKVDRIMLEFDKKKTEEDITKFLKSDQCDKIPF
jgi:plasmid replication initiation protein